MAATPPCLAARLPVRPDSLLSALLTSVAVCSLAGLAPPSNIWIQKAPHPHVSAYQRGGGWGGVDR